VATDPRADGADHWKQILDRRRPLEIRLSQHDFVHEPFKGFYESMMVLITHHGQDKDDPAERIRVAKRAEVTGQGRCGRRVMGTVEYRQGLSSHDLQAPFPLNLPQPFPNSGFVDGQPLSARRFNQRQGTGAIFQLVGAQQGTGQRVVPHADA
jgi:hypothetical protein